MNAPFTMGGSMGSMFNQRQFYMCPFMNHWPHQPVMLYALTPGI